MKIDIWHYTDEDESTCTTITWHNNNFMDCVALIQRGGGLIYGDQRKFVPWHRINYITVADE